MAQSVSFVVLQENRFGWAALEQLRSHGQQSVYLFGPSGSGKTHLARQFVRDLRKDSDSNLRVAHVTAGQLVAEAQDGWQTAQHRHPAETFLASSTRQSDVVGGQAATASGAKRAVAHLDAGWWEPPDDAVDLLQRKYRSLDVLVCEDLTEIGRSSHTQHRLATLFDGVIRRRGRVLLTANCPPGQLEGVSPRLVTRCRTGVCARLEPLGESSRCKFISHLASVNQIPLADEAARLLAAKLPVSARELQEALLRLDESARIQKTDLDRGFVERFLASEVTRPRLKPQQVAAAVARHFSVSVGDLRSGSRLQGLALARHCAMFLCRERTGLALRDISAFFGGRQHSTVLHACRRVEKLLQDRPDVRRDLEQICRVLGTPTIVSGS